MITRTVTVRTVGLLTAALAFTTAVVALLSLSVGSVHIPFGRIIELLVSGGTGGSITDYHILYNVRLPRVLLGACVGAGLALAGVVYQVLLRNVLADPYILGVSGGASVGALAAIATGFAAAFPGASSLAAFAGAAVVAVGVYVLGDREQAEDANTLLLTGVMAGAFLGAVILALVSLGGDPVRNALFWLLGYLGSATGEQVMIAACVLIPSLLILLTRANMLNVLAMGRDTAAHLGVSVRPAFVLLYGIASLLTAVLVSVAGSIGFIGLIIPHICRLVIGPDHRILLPSAFFIGAIFLMLADLLARTVLAPVELPVGAVTAALGAPLFALLLRRRS